MTTTYQPSSSTTVFVANGANVVLRDYNDVYTANGDGFELMAGPLVTGLFVYGYVWADDNGVEVLADNVRIANFGMLNSFTGDAINLSGGAGTVEILNYGTILANDGEVIDIDSAGDTVVNAGTILGNIDLGGGPDFFENAGPGVTAGRVLGGDGVDTLVGGESADRLEGGGGSDTLVGRGGDDVLDGGAADDLILAGLGSDELLGGAGNDTMTGGADADSFVFRTTAQAGIGATRDQVLDFEPGLDVINVVSMSPGVFEFRGTSPFAPSGNPELRLVETATGSTIVQLDANGDGTADAEIRVANVTGLTAEDFTL